MVDKALRFGGLIRVSTERQEEKKHESLRVQRNHIETAVKALGGKVVEWYGGQEHATPGFEKKEINRLLNDAQKGRFDAFVCSDPDRWSRDNEKSRQGLELFLNHGIRFFIRDNEQDLYDPNVMFFLGMSAVVGEYFAANQKRKSIDARIAKARRGCCANGRRPFGRDWDKETETWTVNKTQQAQMNDIARRYLAGESLTDLAREAGMHHGGLHRILTKGSGSTWTQTFFPKARNGKDKGEPEHITIKVPELLPKETIEAVKRRLEANKTYAHGSSKNKYLLARMIFCEHCGYALSGQLVKNQNGRRYRYYRHVTIQRRKQCNHPRSFIPADEIEELVILKLFETFGNPKAVEEAVKRASGDMEKVEEYQERLDKIAADLQKIEKGRQHILDLIVKETISQQQAEAKLKDLNSRETRLQEEQGRLADFIGNRASPEQVKRASEQVAKEWRRLTSRKNTAKRLAARKPLSEMTWEEKRALCEMVFSGKTPDGDRMGVYITWNDDGSDWTLSIRGHLIQEEGLIRWSGKMKAVMREHLEGGAGWTTPKQRDLNECVSSLRENIPRR